MIYTKEDFENMSRVERLNLINSCSGIKPANLIGTQSAAGQPNVAIFSSVVHLGSNPALFGMVFRPQHEKPRDTYLNIRATGFYTINHIPTWLVEQAHFTSAKFTPEISEFDRCAIQSTYLDDFPAPFVETSPLKLGMRLVQEIPIEINKTILMIGALEYIQVADEALDANGNIDLEVLNSAGVGGVNTYYSLKRENRFPYAHVADVPDFSSY